MIAGETEKTLALMGYDEYDHFLGLGKKKADGAPKKTLGERLKNVGKKIDQLGGLQGIGQTVDNVRSLFKKQDPQTPALPADYEIGLQQEQVKDDKSEVQEKEKKDNLLLTGGLIVAGIVVIGMVIWLATAPRRAPVAVPA